MSASSKGVFLDRNTDDVFKVSPKGSKFALCKVCNSDIDVSKGLEATLKLHCQRINHQKLRDSLIAAKPQMSFSSIYEPVTKQLVDPEIKTSIAEGAFVFHSILHDQSFRSLDCVTQLITQIYDPKFSCSKDKGRAMCKGALADYALRQLHVDLQKARHCTLMYDCSTFSNTKLLAILIRYFVPGKRGIQVKLLDIVALDDEKAQTITGKLSNAVREFDLRDKIISICADNTAANFGGVTRKGEGNVFHLMKNALTLNGQIKRKIYGSGCLAHVINNSIQNAIAKHVWYDARNQFKIKEMLHLLRDHFFGQHGSTRVAIYESEICRKAVPRRVAELPLQISDTRWLALVPALERVIKCFNLYHKYFQLIKETKRFTCKSLPKILEFFNNPLTLPWLHTIYEIATPFHNAVKLIEGNSNSISSGIESLDDLSAQLVADLNNGDVYIPQTAIELLTEEQKGDFALRVARIYSFAHEYIAQWSDYLHDFKCLNLEWVDLHTEVTLDQIESSMKGLRQQGVLFDFDLARAAEELEMIQPVIANNAERWNEESVGYDERWSDICDAVELNEISKLLEIVFAIAPSNASTERIFSKVKSYWLDCKSRLSPEMVKAAMVTRFNYINHNNNCGDIVPLLVQEPELLKQMGGDIKYDHKRNALNASLASIVDTDHSYPGPSESIGQTSVAVAMPSVGQSVVKKRSKSRSGRNETANNECTSNQRQGNSAINDNANDISEQLPGTVQIDQLYITSPNANMSQRSNSRSIARNAGHNSNESTSRGTNSNNIQSGIPVIVKNIKSKLSSAMQNAESKIKQPERNIWSDFKGQ